MNLFRRRRSSTPPENTFALACPTQQTPSPVTEIYADRAAAERALKTRPVIRFPADDPGNRHAVQDADGFWRIVPGFAPTKLSEFFD